MYTFDEIKGNCQIIKSLKSAVSHDVVSHAYIFSGIEGSGKKMMAKAFAKTIECSERGVDACCLCMSCKTFDSGNNPDVVYVSASKTKAISVDDIREQIGMTVNIKPYKHRYKIYIIEKADTLTVQAQNALLKTLEEPPYYAVFILLAENTDAFLPTVFSRCILYKLNPIPEEIIKEYLMESLSIDDSEAVLFSRYAQGSLGEALKIASQGEFVNMRDDIISCLMAAGRLELTDVLLKAKALEKYKESKELMDIAYMWFRDVLSLKSMGNEKYIIEKDKLSSLREDAEIYSFEGILNVLDSIWQGKMQLKQNANFVLAMEVLMIKIKGESLNDRGNRNTV